MNSSPSPRAATAPWRRGAIIAARALSALALSLWIGGMAFFGIMAAPVLFHPQRHGVAVTPAVSGAIPTLAPQMVGAMLTRFGVLTTICGLVLLGCWALDGAFSRATRQRAWRAQGVLLWLSVALAFYLNGVLLPQTKAQQGAILPLIARAQRGQTLSSAEQRQRAAFDAGHQSYQKLASLNLYALLGVLLISVARGVPKRDE